MKQRKRSRKGAPGIVDVALLAGVSAATVSRYFNSPDVVKAPTRNRIRQAADDLGYIRDRMAGALHDRSSGTIGLVVPTIDNSIFAELIESFAARLMEHDRTMLIAAHGYNLDHEVAIVRSLLERRIDGIALVGFDHNTIAMNMLARREVPVLSIWNYSTAGDLACIGADNVEAGYAATRHLLDLGHHHITLILADSHDNDRARDRETGARQALSEAGLALAPEHVHVSPYDVGSAKALAIDLLKQSGPRAFVCGNDIIAHGVFYACAALGLRVPDNVSIVGIGDFRGSEHMEPGLTTIRLPARAIGRRAADTIVQMYDSGRAPAPLHEKMPIEFKLRGSTAPAS